MRFPIMQFTWDKIKSLVRPMDASQPEGIPFVLYDTLTYTSAATTKLTFMQQNALAIQTNNVTNGRLPANQPFRISGFCLDILRETTAGAGTAAGAIRDVQRILYNGVFNFKVNNKEYGPIPLTYTKASGGPTGFIGVGGTAGAIVDNQYANNGVFDGGFGADGQLWIPPETQFSVTCEWGAAQTLTGNVDLRFSLYGTLYRQVV